MFGRSDGPEGVQGESGTGPRINVEPLCVCNDDVGDDG